MARGWESKAVESQQEGPELSGDGILRTPEEIERLRKREGLELSRTRITRELTETRSDARRISLQHALQHLNEELSKV